MTITFADGTTLEIAATALDDFLRHDLKWAEFVHGRASTNELACKSLRPAVNAMNRTVHPCPSGSC